MSFSHRSSNMHTNMDSNQYNNSQRTHMIINHKIFTNMHTHVVSNQFLLTCTLMWFQPYLPTCTHMWFQIIFINMHTHVISTILTNIHTHVVYNHLASPTCTHMWFIITWHLGFSHEIIQYAIHTMD